MFAVPPHLLDGSHYDRLCQYKILWVRAGVKSFVNCFKFGTAARYRNERHLVNAAAGGENRLDCEAPERELVTRYQTLTAHCVGSIYDDLANGE